MPEGVPLPAPKGLPRLRALGVPTGRSGVTGSGASLGLGALCRPSEPRLRSKPQTKHGAGVPAAPQEGQGAEVPQPLMWSPGLGMPWPILGGSWPLWHLPVGVFCPVLPMSGRSMENAVTQQLQVSLTMSEQRGVCYFTIPSTCQINLLSEPVVKERGSLGRCSDKKQPQRNPSASTPMTWDCVPAYCKFLSGFQSQKT